jgi:cytochrome c-type biogenesis protein CcmH
MRVKLDWKWMAVLAFVMVGLLVAVPAVRAQDGDSPPPDGVTDDDVNAVAEQLYCPVCENVPLDVCGTQACADWRAEIRTMLEEGQSVDEIKQHFVDFYGRRVLSTPEIRGIDIVVWVLPPIGVLVGVFVLITSLRRMAPGALAAEVDESGLQYDDLDPEYVARVEREVQEYAS